MCFQGSSECIVCFRTFEARYMYFDRISDWRNSRSLFWNDNVILVKLLVFSKYVFRATVQISSDLFVVFSIDVTSMFYGILNWSYDSCSSIWSRDVTQFFCWCCANTIPSLSLVISKIYDALKRISEYLEYFESFQLNIQLEKGYQKSPIKYLTISFCCALRIFLKVNTELRHRQPWFNTFIICTTRPLYNWNLKHLVGTSNYCTVIRGGSSPSDWVRRVSCLAQILGEKKS